MSFRAKNPLSPPAHSDTQSSVFCAPMAEDEVPVHSECKGWVQPFGPDFYECGCWCHKRVYKPFCDSCAGPYTEAQGGDPQYGGHWDTCPNRWSLDHPTPE